MPLKTRDPNSGAIIYEQTAEEKEFLSNQLRIKRMEKDIRIMKENINKLFEMVTENQHNKEGI